MAEHHCAAGHVKGYSSLEMEEYKRNANASEFNPRASSPSSAAADHSRWAPLSNGAPFPAEPMPDSALHATPKWWVSPSHASSTAVFGGAARLPLHSLDSVDHSRLSVHDNALHFAADLSRNNPYLDAALRSPSASWRQMQQPQQQQVNPDDWSCNGSLSSRNARDQERGFLHPVFSDQHPPSAYPVVQPARAVYNFPQLAAANRPPVCPSYANMMNGDGNSKIADDQYGWGAGADQVRGVGKSQSMRALYEENAALRRALFSMRRGSLLALQSEQAIPGEQDRCITSDVAEGRALSMRERGRWAMQAGEVVGAGGNCSMWAGTPRQQWPAGPPLHGTPAAARHYRTHHHNHVWEDAAAEHPLFYAGGSFGGWPEDSMCGNRDYQHWTDMQNESQSGVVDEAGGGEGTSLKQLLVETDRGAMNGHKWRQQGKKKASRNCEQVVGKQAADEEGQTCAMCGGKLRHVDGVGGKKTGLPLRLCPACHPRAAASLPHSTTTKSPPLTSHARQHVATAILMACRPNTTNPHVQEPKFASKKIKPKNRIMDLCRHFVGLAAKPPPTA